MDIGVSGFSLTSFVYHTAILSVPITLSFYLVRDFAFTSKELEAKLSEIQQLSAEKQQILISQKEMLEQKITQRTVQFKQSLEELKATQAQLIQSEKMASLGELTAGIAHEIQNPLNFVNNFSETNVELVQEARTEFKDGNNIEGFTILDNIEENAKKITHHGRRAESIVKGMLEHSRSPKGEKQLAKLNALVDEYLRLAYHGFRAKDKNFNAKIDTKFDESIGKVNIVPQEIGRVLLNLFNNTFYAVAEKKKQVGEGYEPKVEVSSTRGSDKIEITVSDNGIGISKNVVEKIFQPFFTTKPTGEGTGTKK
jgi:two-component system, NtrC family, sensor kinase